MNKFNKRGFTLTELVIVLAIIAVLAAVLIPTFAGLIRKANDSAYQQERTNQMIQDEIEKIEKGKDNYVSWLDFEEAIAKALKDNTLTADKIIEIVGVGKDTGLTNEQLTAILEAIANKKFSDTQVKVILEGVKSGDTSLTQEQIDQIIAKLPQVGITQEDIAAAVDAVLGENNTVAVQIKNAIAAALNNVPSAEDIAAIVEQILNSSKGTVIEVTFKGEKKLLTISEFRDQWNNGDFFDINNPASVKLTGSVDMKKIGNWGPIGTWQYPFFGTFHGNNYTISNLSNHANAEENGNYTHVYSVGNSIGYGETYGFFGIVGGGNTTIQNVTFDAVDIDIKNGKNVGTVIGYVPSNNNFKDTDKGAKFAGDKWNGNSSIGTHSLTLNSVTVSGSVTGSAHVGGLIGKVYSSADTTLKSCTNNANVTATGASRAGGLVATLQNVANATLIDCSNTGVISGDTYAAGLVAYSHTSTNISLTNCSNSGNINCNTGSGRAGGLLGTAGNTSHSIIFDNCSNSGKVYGLVQAGGLIGSVGIGNQAAPITLKNEISNTGEIKAGNYAGGILCSQTAAGDGAGIYKSLTIDSSATFVTTGDVITTEASGVTGTYWVFKYQTSYYYCNSATKTGTLAE